MPDDIPADAVHLAPEAADLPNGYDVNNSVRPPGHRRPRFPFAAETTALSLSNAGLALMGLHRRTRGITTV